MSATPREVGTVGAMDTNSKPKKSPAPLNKDAWTKVPYDPTAAAQPADLGDSKTLIVVRESNMFDFLAFATMIRQILEPLKGIVPGVETVWRLTGANAEIMRNDEAGRALRKQLGARALHQQNRPYGFVFEVEGTIFLFAMTSAFSDSTEDLSNHFTDDLIEQLKLHRPAALVSGPSTRLVRRKDLGEHLGRQAGKLGVRIFTKETPDGIDPNSMVGSTQWTLLGMLAETDFRNTITRLLTGRIFHVRNGGWLAGDGALPLGYNLGDDRKKHPIVGSSAQVEQARLLLKLAAAAGDELSLPDDQRRLTPESIINELSRAGVRKRSNKKQTRSGERIAGTPLGTVTSPKVTLESMLSLLPAYTIEGTVTRMQGLPMAGLTRHDVHSEPIYKKDTNDVDEAGALRFEWHFPKPTNADGEEESWASEEVLASAHTYLTHLQNSKVSRPPSTQQWPPSGLFTAERNGERYRFVYASAGYQWKCEGDAVGKFAAAETTTRMVDAIIDALDELRLDPDTIPMVRSRPHSQASTNELTLLKDRQKQLEDDLMSACVAVRDAREGSRQRLIHQEVVDDLESQLDELAAESNRLVIDVERDDEPDDLRVETLATLLSVLADTAGSKVPPQVCHQLRRMITSGTIDDCWDDASPWGTFRGTIAVPTDQGFVRPVDFTFELGSTSQGPDRKAFWERRMPRVLEMRMSTDISIDELSNRLGAEPSARVVGKNLMKALRPYFQRHGLSKTAAGKAASAIIDCPIVSTRSIIWALLTNQPMPQTIEDLDPTETKRHIENLEERYLSDKFDWTAFAWSTGGESFRREVVRWVGANTSAEAPDDGVLATELAAVAGLQTVNPLRSVQWLGSKYADGKARVLERTTPWPSPLDIEDDGSYSTPVPDDEKRLKLRACPHCGHQGLHPVACVEFGEDPVICPECRRHPWDPTLRRPSSYLANYEGPWGRTRASTKPRQTDNKRTGTVIIPKPAMLSMDRVRRTQRHRLKAS